MRIGIDYDGTWTEDPGFWNQVVRIGQNRGHRFVMVTARSRGSDDMLRGDLPADLPIVYTAGRELKQKAALQAGHHVDTWIDGMPGTIQRTILLEPTADKLL
jgi:hydroxymethylpyrimidine pyrophosphatase-like HAD family hydrolase